MTEDSEAKSDPRHQFPMYECHKVVGAAKIKAVHSTEKPDGSRVLQFEYPRGVDPEQLPRDLRVGAAWAGKHEPKAGGYYVVYADGYASYSPAAAFEGGYSLIEDDGEDVAFPDEDAVEPGDGGVEGGADNA